MNLSTIVAPIVRAYKEKMKCAGWRAENKEITEVFKGHLFCYFDRSKTFAIAMQTGPRGARPLKGDKVYLSGVFLQQISEL